MSDSIGDSTGEYTGNIKAGRSARLSNNIILLMVLAGIFIFFTLMDRQFFSYGNMITMVKNMKTYFMQHGLALASDIDPARPLSEEGKVETARIGTLLQRHDIRIDQILHSGKLRAEQTASIMAETLGISEIRELAGMGPNDNPQQLIDQLDQDHSLHVGHLPHIQRVVTRLITTHDDPAVIQFRNSAVACVQLAGEGNRLNWFITPQLC